MASSNPPWKRPAPASLPKKALQRWLIVSEDEKSSLLYFRGFTIDQALLEIDPIGGAGDPRSVVARAIQLKEEAETARRPYARVFAVFDRDEWPLDNFQAALHMARQRGVTPIWSNEAFELWYVLHLAYRDTAMSRANFHGWLTEHLRAELPDPVFTYAKNDSEIYGRLKQWQRVALKNADRLLDSHTGKPHPERENPSTNVQNLVRELNRFLET